MISIKSLNRTISAPSCSSLASGCDVERTREGGLSGDCGCRLFSLDVEPTGEDTSGELPCNCDWCLISSDVGGGGRTRSSDGVPLGGDGLSGNCFCGDKISGECHCWLLCNGEAGMDWDGCEELLGKLGHSRIVFSIPSTYRRISTLSSPPLASGCEVEGTEGGGLSGDGSR